jgi:hypothetical protein
MVVLSGHAVTLVFVITFLATTVRGQVQTDLSHLVQCNPASQSILDGVKPYERIRIQRAYNFFAAQALPFHPVTVGVVDSGLDRLQPEFQGVNIRLGLLASLALDLLGHGTSVAGIVGANNLGLTTCTPSNRQQMNGIVSGFSSLYSMEVRGPTIALDQVSSYLDSLGKLQVSVVNLTRTPSASKKRRRIPCPGVPSQSS